MKEIKLNKLKETIYYDKCSNGLDIYMWVNEKVNNYYASLNVKYGSIDTNFMINNTKYNVPNGIAHYLEHLEFTDKNGNSVDNFFDLQGTSVNAFTTFEYTSYNIYGSNNIYDNLNYLLDFVQDKYINNNLIDKERNIITEEIKMDKNNPGQKMFYAINKAIYNQNNKRNEIAGLESDIKKIKKEDLEVVFDNFYSPDNMFLVITGNFNPYEISAVIKENQKEKKVSNKNIIKKIHEKEDNKILKDYIEIDGNIEIPKLSINYKLSRKVFKEYNDLYLNNYLRIIFNSNFGPSSNLKEDLLEKNLINSLSTDISVDKDSVIISIYSDTKYPEEIIDIVKDKMKKLSLSIEQLKRRVKCNIANLISGIDDIEFTNTFIQESIINYDKVINNIYSIYNSLNLEEVNNIISKIKLDNTAIIVMKPKKNTNNC